MAELRPCDYCGTPTLWSLRDGSPICWRPCMHALWAAEAQFSVAGPARDGFIYGSLR